MYRVWVTESVEYFDINQPEPPARGATAALAQLRGRGHMEQRAISGTVI